MQTFSLLRVIPNSLRNPLKYKAFLVVYKSLNNSAFIIDVVTVFYLFIFKKAYSISLSAFSIIYIVYKRGVYNNFQFIPFPRI